MNKTETPGRKDGLVRIGADADFSTLEAAIGGAAGALFFRVESPVALAGDLALPPGATLLFAPGGRLDGAGTLTGRGAGLEAGEHAAVFGPGVALAGDWRAVFHPAWFGAVYDGATDCTAAIQKCLDRRGEVRLRGRGTALISAPLEISGGTWLHFDPGFTVRLADNACCVMLRTRWADQRYFDDRFPGFVTDPSFPGFVSGGDNPGAWQLGEPEKNIRVTGGTWDANGGKNPRQTHRWGSYGYRGFLMVLVNVKGFVLRDATLYDATTYFFDAALLSDFAIDNIHLDMRELRPNQDGIHLEGECYNGVISNIHGRTWDDMVALNGGDSWYPKYPPGVEAPPRGTGTNILWKSFLQGGISRVVIRDIHVSEGLTGYRAVRLLSTGAHKMDEITIDGIYGRYAVNAVLISAHYESEAPYGTIVIRNLACTVEGTPESAEYTRNGLVWLENDKVSVDTLIIDGASYERTGANGQFLRCQGSIRRLFVSNLNISVAGSAEFFGRGAFNCVGGPRALVHEAYFCNLSVNGENGARYDIAFQGHWRRVKMVNCLVAAGTVFELGDYAEADIRESNCEFICDAFVSGALAHLEPAGNR